jgi:hypothetical protein
VFEDADDLVALVDNLGLAPVRIAGDSGGVAVVSRAATRGYGGGGSGCELRELWSSARVLALMT